MSHMSYQDDFWYEYDWGWKKNEYPKINVASWLRPSGFIWVMDQNLVTNEIMSSLMSRFSVSIKIHCLTSAFKIKRDHYFVSQWSGGGIVINGWHNLRTAPYDLIIVKDYQRTINFSDVALKSFEFCRLVSEGQGLWLPCVDCTHWNRYIKTEKTA